jgi:hypothetical protein
MSATATWQGADQAGNDAIFDLGGSGSVLNFTQSRIWATAIALAPIFAGQNSYYRQVRMKFSGTFNDLLDPKLWRSDGNTLSDGVTIKAGGLGSPGTGVAYTTPSLTGSGDPNLPVVEPGAANLTIDPTGAIRYAPALVAGANRWVRLQLQTLADTPPGPISTGDPHFTLTLKYTEN